MANNQLSRRHCYCSKCDETALTNIVFVIIFTKIIPFIFIVSVHFISSDIPNIALLSGEILELLRVILDGGATMLTIEWNAINKI